VPRDSSEILSEPPPPAADARVAYGSEPLQFGDLRLPPGEGPHPVAVVVHGGYWKATTNLTHTGHMCEALRTLGIATWNVEYRRVGDVGGGWPATADDVQLAVERQPVEAAGVVLVGHSAGGHLALLAGKRARLPVVALAPVADLAWSLRGGGGDGAAAAFLGGNSVRDASPRELLPLGVRHVVVHGTDDETVELAMSEAYVAAAREAGDDVELIRLDGAGHFEPVDPQAAEWPTVVDAIRSLLGPAAPAQP
jgi:acetyl esterase/lipase